MPPLPLGPLQDAVEDGVAGEAEEEAERAAHAGQEAGEVVQEDLLLVLNLNWFSEVYSRKTLLDNTQLHRDLKKWRIHSEKCDGILNIEYW